MNDSVELIHVGYHRCASTTLQHCLFSHHPQIAWTKKSRLAYDSLIGMENVWFHSDAESRNQSRVISSEGLCGVDYTTSRLRPRWLEIPAMIHDKWPEARILMIIRQQPKLIRSYYSLSIIKQAITVRPKAYYDGIFQKQYLNYDQPISRYQKLFGASNVCVLPFEMLVRDQAAFLSRISEFSGVDFSSCSIQNTNAGSSDAANDAIRRLNYAFRVIGEQNPITGGKKRLRGALASILSRKSTFFEPGDEQAIREYYRASNRRTSKLINLDLIGEYGY